ncbi:hypothetical protein AaE_015037 [Aphanomyces astaci]|uniref:Uncharacterized protein n=1 Tax=Aphanomyces astaci TaxID=112090 RepID=A0A6A4ZA91_APHAT|nr:hypothetical protein AaE_015037 [Aphanomyces astaci]
MIPSTDWTTINNNLVRRLEVHRSSAIRLSRKEHATQPGRRLAQLVMALPVANIPRRQNRRPMRFVLKAVEYSNEVVVQVYNPRSSIELQVVSLEVPGEYTVMLEMAVDAILRSHIVLELQRHVRRKLAQRRAQDLAVLQWLRVQVKNRYQYVHAPSGLWRHSSKPAMLRDANPVNVMCEWYYVGNYTQTKVPYAYYILPRRIVCCSAVFWLSASSNDRRQLALSYLSRYRTQLLESDVELVHQRFYHWAVVNHPLSDMATHTYAVFLHLVRGHVTQADTLYNASIDRNCPRELVEANRRLAHVNGDLLYEVSNLDDFALALRPQDRRSRTNPVVILQRHFRRTRRHYLRMPSLFATMRAISVNALVIEKFQTLSPISSPITTESVENYILHMHLVQHTPHVVASLYASYYLTSPAVRCGYALWLLSESSPGSTTKAVHLLADMTVEMKTNGVLRALEVTFLRFVVMCNPPDVQGLLNYALYAQFVLQQYDVAERLFAAAVAFPQDDHFPLALKVR